MVTLKTQDEQASKSLSSRIVAKLSHCEAYSLARLKEELAVQGGDDLARELRAMVDAGRVEALDPVHSAGGRDGSGGTQEHDHRFYRLIRASDTLYEWEQTADRWPPSELAQTIRCASGGRTQAERRM